MQKKKDNSDAVSATVFHSLNCFGLTSTFITVFIAHSLTSPVQASQSTSMFRTAAVENGMEMNERVEMQCVNTG